MKKIIFFMVALAAGALFLFYPLPGGKEPGSPATREKIPLGMNLSSVTYWTRELPFVNVFMTAMPWVTQNHQPVPGAANPWDTKKINSIPLDENGYPRYLPVSVTGAEAPQIVATLMCREINGHYPSGQYVCLYDGDGDLQFGYDAKVMDQAPGRLLLNVTPSQAGIFLKITRSNIANPVKNIRVIMPGFESTYEKHRFNPRFLSRLKPFSPIRFMDWQATNNSVWKHWDERTKPTAYTQAGAGGVALEYMIALCNELNADAWFCLPHPADSELNLRFAEWARDHLKPELKIFLEYSNEVWNPSFAQYRWVEQNGSPELTHPEKYAQLATNAFNIWVSVFNRQRERLIRVAAGQQVSVWKIKQAMKYFGENGVDAIGCSGYFGLSPKNYDLISKVKSPVSAADIMRLVAEDMPSQIQSMKHHETVAKTYHKSFVVYEGGQSLSPMPLGSHPPFINALWEAQTSREMHDAYLHFFNEIQKDMEINAFCAFSLAAKQKTPFGSWGHLDYIDQPAVEAPKYKALIDYLGFQEAP